MGNVTIQKEIQKSREHEFESLRFDLVQEVANAYLNILRAKTFERIQADNLKVSQTNYETAKIRESIGSASPGEVYRWEAEVASGQQTVISATVQREISEQALNRILGYPLTRKFRTEETDINDERLITSKEKLFSIINNPWAYEVFADFLAEEALKVSPEIRALDAAILAQERYHSSTGRAFWLPTLAAQAQYDNVFDRSGEGSSVELSGFGISPPKDQSWSVALNASLPIFSGGSKYFERQQAYLDLKKLMTDRESLRQKIEQRTRLALKNSRYSGASIRLSKKAADAAKKNLDIILDAYGRGAVSIIELLDAQNAALVTDQVASNAVFDFLIDIINVERAVGRFDFFITDKEQEVWIEKFEAYYNERINNPE
jgi:outer membrane protein TolC